MSRTCSGAVLRVAPQSTLRPADQTVEGHDHIDLSVGGTPAGKAQDIQSDRYLILGASERLPDAPADVAAADGLPEPAACPDSQPGPSPPVRCNQHHQHVVRSAAPQFQNAREVGLPPQPFPRTEPLASRWLKPNHVWHAPTGVRGAGDGRLGQGPGANPDPGTGKSLVARRGGRRWPRNQPPPVGSRAQHPSWSTLLPADARHLDDRGAVGYE